MQKWAILIPTIPARAAMFAELCASLKAQLQPGVSIRTLCSDPQPNIASVRNALIDQAASEYVSFVDDDDAVADDFVAAILPHLNGVDCVQYQTAFFKDGVFQYNDRCSLAFGEVGQDYRDISHRSVIRRELVLPFEHRIYDTANYHNEDIRWVDAMRRAARLKTETLVDRPIYFYHLRTQRPEFG